MLDSPTTDSRLPAYLKLRDELATRIIAGEWAVDQTLPSDNRLSTETGLSVGTVRKAIQQLVDEGVLERRQGTGTFLRKPAFDSSLFRFFQVRENGVQNTIPKSEILSRERMVAPRDVAELLGADDVIRIERLRYLSDQPLLSEEIYIPVNLFEGFETLNESEIGPLLYPVYYDRFGVFVARAEDEVRFETADALSAKRLGIAKGDPLAVIERLAMNMAGGPVEWRIACGPATRFRYRSCIG